VDKTKWTVVAIAIAAVVALILVVIFASVIRIIIDLAIVVGAIYLIARVMVKRNK
jgi:hypothetical protein